MKSSLRQLQEKYGQRHMDPTVSFYAQTLQNLVEVSGDGKSYRDDPRPLTTRLRANEVYAVKCEDDDRYWKSIFIKNPPQKFEAGMPAGNYTARHKQ